MPRTEAQFGEIREQKTALIMQTALELFANEGYYQTSISKIAQKAGISKGLMYNYFESKDELVLAIIGKGAEQLTEPLDPDRDGFLSEEEFVFFVNENFRILQENFDYWKLYFSTMMQPAVYRLVKEKFPHFLPPLNVVEGYFQRKGVADPGKEAIYLDAVLDGVYLNYIMDPDAFPLEEVRKIILERFT
jgi:AcrR family transcriptional regulator